MRLGLEGKVAIVTGGSKGLGRAIAKEFGQEGARLSICARGKADLEGAAREKRELGIDVLALEADVTRLDDIQQVVTKTVDECGRIDILVNNAGTRGLRTPSTPLTKSGDTAWMST
jgi:3-oxoacyl-[acyl-carrier protein] reductase